MDLLEYDSYEKYIAAQEAANRMKINQVWVSKSDIKMLSKYITEKLDCPEFGICHGTRNGKEQSWFREFLNIVVIGTEISSTALEFPFTIQWDFHDVKDEWIGAVDFIYSNSFDHSYNPQGCLDAWMSCVRPGGFCIIEWGDTCDRVADESDPFAASVGECRCLLSQKYEIIDELLSVDRKKKGIVFFIVGHREYL